jgi:hypothetical protein
MKERGERQEVEEKYKREENKNFKRIHVQGNNVSHTDNGGQ